MQCGVSINPSSSVETLWSLLETGLVSLVDVLAVEPGFGGQSFQTIALSKVKKLQAWREQRSASFTIMVDGGTNEKTASSVMEAGADVLVAGSYLFQHEHGLKQGQTALLASLAKRPVFHSSKTA